MEGLKICWRVYPQIMICSVRIVIYKCVGLLIGIQHKSTQFSFFNVFIQILIQELEKK